MLCGFMRERFNIFILAMALGLILGQGCSKSKAPETTEPQPASQQEAAPAPEPAENAPSPSVPEPAPAVPAPPESPPAPAPSEEQTPEKSDGGLSLWDRLRPSAETAPPSVPKEEPLRVYYQKDPVPEPWCAAWTAAGHGPVVQARFPAGASLPRDGDVYLFTPDLFAQILSGPGALKLEEGWARAGLDPVFTGHPFDVDNTYTRPWRWTPYLLYGLSSRTAPWKDRHMADLWADPKALWPDQLALLTGLALKDEKLSANPRNDARWISLHRELQGRLHDKLAAEAECWRKLQAGEIELTLLPASCRLSLPADAAAALDWTVPAGGTLIYFEQIAVGEHTKKKEAALSFAEYLLQAAQQKRLLAETGYFSVRTKPGGESQQAVLNLKQKEWFDQSEFLMETPAVPSGESGPAAGAAVQPVAEPAKAGPAPSAENSAPPAP